MGTSKKYKVMYNMFVNDKLDFFIGDMCGLAHHT